MKRALLGAFLLSAHAAAALCPAPPTKACNAWFVSDQVFLGKVTRAEYTKVRSPHDSGRWAGGFAVAAGECAQFQLTVP